MKLNIQIRSNLQQLIFVHFSLWLMLWLLPCIRMFAVCHTNSVTWYRRISKLFVTCQRKSGWQGCISAKTNVFYTSHPNWKQLSNRSQNLYNYWLLLQRLVSCPKSRLSHVGVRLSNSVDLNFSWKQFLFFIFTWTVRICSRFRVTCPNDALWCNLCAAWCHNINKFNDALITPKQKKAGISTVSL